MKARKKAEATIYLNLRLPKDLHRRLASEAKRAKPRRSLNTEILVRLWRTFELQNADELLKRAEAQRKETDELFNLVAERFGMPKVQPRVYGLLAPADKIGKPIPEDEK